MQMNFSNEVIMNKKIYNDMLTFDDNLMLRRMQSNSFECMNNRHLLYSHLNESNKVFTKSRILKTLKRIFSWKKERRTSTPDIYDDRNGKFYQDLNNTDIPDAEDSYDQYSYKLPEYFNHESTEAISVSNPYENTEFSIPFDKSKNFRNSAKNVCSAYEVELSERDLAYETFVDTGIFGNDPQRHFSAKHFPRRSVPPLPPRHSRKFSSKSDDIIADIFQPIAVYRPPPSPPTLFPTESPKLNKLRTENINKSSQSLDKVDANMGTSRENITESKSKCIQVGNKKKDNGKSHSVKVGTKTKVRPLKKSKKTGTEQSLNQQDSMDPLIEEHLAILRSQQFNRQGLEYQSSRDWATSNFIGVNRRKSKSKSRRKRFVEAVLKERQVKPLIKEPSTMSPLPLYLQGKLGRSAYQLVKSDPSKTSVDINTSKPSIEVLSAFKSTMGDKLDDTNIDNTTVGFSMRNSQNYKTSVYSKGQALMGAKKFQRRTPKVKTVTAFFSLENSLINSENSERSFKESQPNYDHLKRESSHTKPSYFKSKLFANESNGRRLIVDSQTNETTLISTHLPVEKQNHFQVNRTDIDDNLDKNSIQSDLSNYSNTNSRYFRGNFTFSGYNLARQTSVSRNKLRTDSSKYKSSTVDMGKLKSISLWENYIKRLIHRIKKTESLVKPTTCDEITTSTPQLNKDGTFVNSSEMRRQSTSALISNQLTTTTNEHLQDSLLDLFNVFFETEDLN